MIGNMILLIFLEAILFMPKVSGVNLAYFKMYDMENVDGEKPALQFNKSEPHLSSDFQRIMANTHQICTNGLWRLFPGSSYSLTGSNSAQTSYPAGVAFGSSTNYETCIILSMSSAIQLSKMGSLRRVGPENLEEISLRTYTGTHYSGIESIIDGENMEDRNLRGYMDSYVITGPRYQHPDNASAFIPTFQFFQRFRYTGEQTCLVMRNDMHGNPIPRKGAAFTSSIYEKLSVEPEKALKFGSVKLIPYSDYFYGLSCTNHNTTIFAPDGDSGEDTNYQLSHGYGSGTSLSGYPIASSPSFSYTPNYQPPSYNAPSSYEPVISSYQPSYQPPSYSPPSYNAPSYEPVGSYYQPSYQPPSYVPYYEPAVSYQPSYQPPSYSPPSYSPANEPAVSSSHVYTSAYESPTYQPAYYQPSYQPPSYVPSSSYPASYQPAPATGSSYWYENEPDFYSTEE